MKKVVMMLAGVTVANPTLPCKSIVYLILYSTSDVETSDFSDDEDMDGEETWIAPETSQEGKKE